MAYKWSFGEKTYQISNEWNFAVGELIKYEIAFSKTTEKRLRSLKKVKPKTKNKIESQRTS